MGSAACDARPGSGLGSGSGSGSGLGLGGLRRGGGVEARRHVLCLHGDQQREQSVEGANGIAHRPHVAGVLVHEEHLEDTLGKVDERQTRYQSLATVDLRRGREHGSGRQHRRHVDDQHAGLRRDLRHFLVRELAVAGRRRLLVRERQDIQALRCGNRKAGRRDRAVDRQQHRQQHHRGR
eukprot:scaffold78017_cov66-Phaeocystis_antarctica.AAC.2